MNETSRFNVEARSAVISSIVIVVVICSSRRLRRKLCLLQKRNTSEMFCLVVFGHRYMGACDYFTYNGGEFYVNARMYHVQFCPLSVDQAVLKLPTMPDRGLAITQVPGIHWRCFIWAVLRSYTIIGCIIALLIGLFLLNHSSSTAWLFIILAIVLGLVGIIAFFYKPKASTERVAMYMDMIRPQLPSSAGIPLQESIKATSTSRKKEGFGSNVVDMVRPLGHYESLRETTPPPTEDV